MDIDGAPWHDGEAGVVGGDVCPTEKFVGFSHGGNARQPEFFDKTILVRLKTPFHPALGLGT